MKLVDLLILVLFVSMLSGCMSVPTEFKVWEITTRDYLRLGDSLDAPNVFLGCWVPEHPDLRFIIPLKVNDPEAFALKVNGCGGARIIINPKTPHIFFLNPTNPIVVEPETWDIFLEKTIEYGRYYDIETSLGGGQMVESLKTSERDCYVPKEENE